MKILAIDPSVNALKLLLNNLEQYGYELQGALDIALASNVVRMGYQAEIVMINISLLSPQSLSDLQQMLQEMNNPYLSILAISDIESEASRMQARAMGFRGFISKPFDIKAILTEIERIAQLGTEEFALSLANMRREPRFRVALEVILEVTDGESNRSFREQTLTEDISRTGGSVLTMLRVRVGELVSIEIPDHGITCMAVVRGSFIGSDRIRRLNIEVLGKQWEEIFFKTTGQQPAEPTPAAPVASAEATASQLLNDRYQLQRLLGRGGLGVVYQALDLATQQTVAVKLLLDLSDRASNQSLPRQFFEREIKMLSQVRHPNIVSILDSGISNAGRPYLVMEYIKGTPLSDLIQQERIWSVARTLHLLKQICPALHAMHLKKIIHRDLKPANIIIQQSGKSEVAMLLDLGIAKMVRGSNDASLIKSITQTGMIVGTVQYIAPEQCLGKGIDEGVDIYSLGVMVYELLTGQMPFHSDSFSGWLIAQVQTAPTPLRKVNPNLSEAIERVVLWALAKERKQRPATTIEFLQYFEEAAKQYESGTQKFNSSTESSEGEDTPTVFLLPED